MAEFHSQPSTPENEQAMLDLEAVLNLPQGRRFLGLLLERAGLTRTAYTESPIATALRLGEQNVGLWLVAQLEQLGPTTYPQLLLDLARKEKTENVRVLDQE